MDNRDTNWQPVVLDEGGPDNLFIEVSMAGGREEIGLLDVIPFNRITSLVTEVASALGTGLAKCNPSKAGLELGIEFGVREGRLVGLIAQGSGKANLKVTLEWDRAKAQE